MCVLPQGPPLLHCTTADVTDLQPGDTHKTSCIHSVYMLVSHVGYHEVRPSAVKQRRTYEARYDL
jgi:hypothetical protein